MNLEINGVYYILVSPIAFNPAGNENHMPTPESFEAEWNGSFFKVKKNNVEFPLSEIHSYRSVKRS